MVDPSETTMRRRASVYLSVDGALRQLPDLPAPVGRVTARVVAVWRAAWLGLVDTDDLNAITRATYMDGTDFASADFNVEQGLWPWESATVRDHLGDCRSVLVVGAGGGREVIALARLGLAVTAVDFSPVLTAACRRNVELAGCPARVLDGPPDGLPQGLSAHDAVLIGRGCYHHVPSRARRVGLLRAGRATLDVGDPLVVADFFTREPGSRSNRWIPAVANPLRRLRGQRERVHPGDRLGVGFQHGFTRGEIEGELAEAGFELEHYARSPFGDSSNLAHALGRAT